MMEWLRTDRGLAAILTTFTLLISIGVVTTTVVFLKQRDTDARIATESSRTTTALCALRGDLQGRVTATEKYLKGHPQGFAGIPAATFRVQVEGQKRTIRALMVVDC